MMIDRPSRVEAIVDVTGAIPIECWARPCGALSDVPPGRSNSDGARRGYWRRACPHTPPGGRWTSCAGCETHVRRRRRDEAWRPPSSLGRLGLFRRLPPTSADLCPRRGHLTPSPGTKKRMIAIYCIDDRRSIIPAMHTPHGGAASPLSHQRQPFLLGQHLDTEISCLGELRARARTVAIA